MNQSNQGADSADFSATYLSIQQAIQQAQFSRAEQQAQQYLEKNTNDEQKQQLYYLLAVAQRYQQKLSAAQRSLNKLLVLAPRYGRAHQEMAYVLLGQKQIEEGVQALLQAVHWNPALLSSWQALLELSQRPEWPTDIIVPDYAGEQCRYLNDLPEPILAARDLFYEGKLQQAEQLCRQYLQQHKQNIDGMSLLAEIGIKLRVYDDAEFLLESCFTLAPEHQRAATEYLALLVRLGKYHAAKPVAAVLRQQGSASLRVNMAIASIELGLGRTKQAITAYQHIITEQPQRAGVYLQLGHAFKADGQLAQAIAAYHQTIQLAPQFGDAYWSLANTKTYRFNDTELAAMQNQLQQCTLGTEDRIHLCFALGKAFEDCGDYAQSFNYYQQGNQLRHQQSGYQVDNTLQQIDAQIQHCDKALFAAHQDSGCADPAPIFIVGLPRAGSTLLEQILASHSQVDGTMELHNVLSQAMRLRGRVAEGESRYPANLVELNNEYFQRFGEKYLQDTQVYRHSGIYFVDKMPNNFLHIGLIKLMLPNAKVIDARREPMACCFSGYKQLFGEGQEFSYDLHSIGRYYRGYQRLMAHWDDVLPGFVLRVQHEDLVADLEGQVRRLLEFCGLPFEQSCVEFHRTERAIKTPSSEQVRQPIYTSGLTQWQHFETYLAPLKAALNSIESA